MFEIETMAAGLFQTNCYLLSLRGSEDAILIDTPPDCGAMVDAALKRLGKRLEAVIITHPHFDHTLDAGVFTRRGIAVYAHFDALEGVRNPQTLGLIPTPKGGFPETGEILALEPGGKIELAGMNLELRDVPGHSDGSLAIYVPGHCFVGDAIFAGSVGRTDLPGGDMQVLAESILSQIYTLPDDTVLYPGHGPATTVAREKSSNPFVRA